MCPYPALSGRSVRARMDWKLYRRIITDVREARRRVRLCLMLQNEPLLDKRFYRMIAEAHEAEDAILSISTVTNGSVLSTELLNRLVAFDRFNLTISVNANDAERYREVHGVDLWSRISLLLKSWDGPRNRVRLSFVADAQSVSEARKFIADWTELGYGTRLVPIMSRARSVPIPLSRRMIIDDFNHCHYPVDTLNLLADGTVILCCNDWEHHETFGNLNDQSISDIWNSSALTRIREAAINGTIRNVSRTCAGCDYPMRSSVRMQLEDLCQITPSRGSSFSIVPHATELRLRDGSVLSIVVFEIDAARGKAMCVVESARLPFNFGQGSVMEFCIRIAHGERFSFGSLEPVWCPANVQMIETFVSDGTEITVLQINLSSQSRAYALVQWYGEDWRL